VCKLQKVDTKNLLKYSNEVDLLRDTGERRYCFH